MDRRDFLSQLTAASASALGATTAAAGVVLDNTADAAGSLYDELERRLGDLSQEIYDEVEQRVGAVSDEVTSLARNLSGRVNGLALRIEGVAAQVAMQQVMMRVLFLLVVTSFAIDGGIAYFMLTDFAVV